VQESLEQAPLQIIILGGGTAGWMAAAALADATTDRICNITLIESEDIGSVGVGEATLPHMKEFNDRIGINEADMMKFTQATFKMGVEFVDWGSKGSSYIHPFGKHGESLQGNEFHQLWGRVRKHSAVSDIGAYSYAIESCRRNQFEFPVSDANYINSTYSYAYHFDASLYALYLRNRAQQLGVRRVESKIVAVEKHPDSGNIKALVLSSGQKVSGDFFIDCSGFRSLLLAQEMHQEFEDWTPWLMCDRAWALPSEKLAVIPPYTRSTAKEAGWQWRIPLQHRTGNGYVFSSQFSSEQQALDLLVSSVSAETKPLADGKLLKFKAGRYKNTWVKNCVAIGLSSGFLEPLESTSIYLIQIAIQHLLKLFPGKIPNEKAIGEYNRLIDNEYARIRDFLILHYKVNDGTKGPFWEYCKNMDVPDSLKEKMALFKQRGHIEIYKYGLFSLPSWVSVFIGQHFYQEGFDPFCLGLTDQEIITRLQDISSRIGNKLADVPSHQEFIHQFCAAKAEA
jgi:tryptophan halogenase